MIDTTKKLTGLNIDGTSMQVGDLATKTITTNGTYNAQTDDGVNGYSEVVVSVSGSANLGTKSITTNGTYSASSDSLDGYSSVTVNVSGGGGSGLKSFLDAKGNADYLLYESGMTDQQVASALSYSDTANCTTFKRTFANMTYATTIPLIDTTSASSMEEMFYQSSIATLPQGFDTSSVYSMRNMFAYNGAITTLPSLDLSNCGDVEGMFSACTSLANITALQNYDLKGKNLNSMFNGCSSITNVSYLLDIEDCTTMSYMFATTGITSDVAFDNASAVDNISGLYCMCQSLVTATHVNDFRCGYMGSLFENCTSLTTVGDLDCSGATDLWNAFYNCTSLTSLGIYGALVDFDLSSCELLPASELSTIIDNLGDVASDGNMATGEYTATLTLGATNLAKISQTDIDTATAKGWTLA